MRYLIFLLTSSAFAAQSVVMNGSYTGSFTVTNSLPFSSLTSMVWDFRFTNFTYPLSCTIINQYGGQLRICPSSTFGKTLVWFGPDTTAGGVPGLIEPPSVVITAISATNPTVLTVASAPLTNTMIVGSSVAIGNVAGTGCTGINGNQTITAVTTTYPYTITVSYNSTGCSGYTASSGSVYSREFLLRVHRDLLANAVTMESWNVDGTGYISSSVGITATGSLGGLPTSEQIGDSNSTYALAYLRWYKGVLSSGAKPPWGSSCNITGLSCLGDWEFEGNGNDSSGYGLNVTFTSSASYVTTPIYNPACPSLPQLTVLAGTSMKFDWSSCFPLDGGSSLTYSATQDTYTANGVIAQAPAWSGATTATPTVTGLKSSFGRSIIGPFNVMLTVTDGSANSSTFHNHNGVVNADVFGHIQYPDSRFGTIIGPQVASVSYVTWPWYQTISTLWGQRLGGFQGTIQAPTYVYVFQPTWNTAVAAATMTATNGSATVSFSGYNPQSALPGCTNSTAPSANSYLVGWYAFPSAFGLSGGTTGRRIYQISTCPSTSSVTIAQNWSPPSQSGMQFAIIYDSTVGSWINGSANINYYDDVLAFYTQFFGSGIEDYLNWARYLADAWWASPWIDKGNPNDCGSNLSLCENFGVFPRLMSFTGMYLRAIDQDLISGTPGSSPMWLGLQSIVVGGGVVSGSTTGALGYTMNARVSGPYLAGDMRENSYNDMFVALETWLDPTLSIGNRSTWLSNLSAALSLWGSGRQSDGHWQSFAGTYSNVNATWSDISNTWPSACSVTATNGTTTVTLASCANTFSSGMFTDTCSGSPCAEIFMFGSPYSTNQRDSQYYLCTYVNSTTCTLNTNYLGTTGSGKNWVLSSNSTTGSNGAWIGFGTQPFTQGINGWMYYFMAQAFLSGSGYGAPAATALGYVYDAANWISTSTLTGAGGTDPATRGALYGVGFGICTPGSSTGSDGCRCASLNASCSTIQASRENIGEALGELAIGYTVKPNVALASQINNVYSACFAKYPANSGYDGSYCWDYDPNGPGGSGSFWLTNSGKWYGFLSGMGRNELWQGVYFSSGGVTSSKGIGISGQVVK